MRFAAIAVAAASTLALAACGHEETTTVTAGNTTETVDTAAPEASTPSPGQSFANAAAASDAFEIATSRLALTRSTSAAVKRFAQKMIDAHTASTAKLRSATAGTGPTITPDPTLTTEQQTTLTSLQGASGAPFDHAYIAAQIDGHQKTLDTLRAYSASGDVPTLKVFATNLIPTVTAHLNMARGLR